MPQGALELKACSDFTQAAPRKVGTPGFLCPVVHSPALRPASVGGQGCCVTLRIALGQRLPETSEPCSVAFSQKVGVLSRLQLSLIVFLRSSLLKRCIKS